MARLPAPQTLDLPETTLSAKEIHRRMVVADAIIKGLKPPTIAAKLHPKDKTARRLFKFQIYAWINRDPIVNYLLAEASQANLRVGLPKMTEALTRRGERGRVDAIKLAMEATGFHNPRIQHEHSGEISVKIDVPRPQAVEDIVDAEVVGD